MSEDKLRSECESELLISVRNVLEERGDLNKMKCLLQKKILEIVRGEDDEEIESPKKTEINQKLLLLNQLIMEYLHWYGYQYTAEMFASESGVSIDPPPRKDLDKIIIGEHQSEIPILLDLVIKAMDEKNK